MTMTPVSDPDLDAGYRHGVFQPTVGPADAPPDIPRRSNSLATAVLECSPRNGRVGSDMLSAFV